MKNKIKRIAHGSWPENDIRRAFVDGAKWWEYISTGFTMWQSDQRLAEKEAERRYGEFSNKDRQEATTTSE